MTETAAVSVETLAEEMYQLVAECAGKKNLKAVDLTKEMIARHGDAACGKDDCKKAIRILIDSGRCIYSYLGGSYIQLPSKEGTE
ncbi:DsrD [Candidatus Sulfotelmatomonas gaucii]|uniref:DsrD n=1 Tax=Candidatus Sulfuritelmatomonas gaucii TaxID=2043161 RepID=A0A2N9M692_9BACT|nr:DsrD [Candidatus Sulfotelmatomonas gaucii]